MALVVLVLVLTGALGDDDSASTAAYVDDDSSEVAYALPPEAMDRLASDSHIIGPVDAPVTVLEFGDFQ